MVLTFEVADYVVLALFALGVLALGFSARLRSLTAIQYLAAGRKLTLPVFVATLVSTWYGGILGMGESVAYFGVGAWVLLGLPYYVFALFYAWKLATRVRGAEEISIPERLERRFGRGVAIAGGLLVFLLAVPAAHALMLGTLLQSLTGWALLPSILIASVVGLAFLYKGGLLADAKVSLLSFAMMYVGFIVVVGWCLTHAPLIQPLRDLGNPALLRWDGGSGVPYVVSFFILGAWTLVDPGFHQRVASAESIEVGRRGVFVSVGFWILFDLLSITAGLYALTLVKPMPENPILLFPALAQTALPAGLKAIFFCGMLGTILTAFVGYTLVAGGAIGRDVVGRVLRAPDERATRLTRAALFAAAALAIVLALTIQSVVSLWYAWAGAVVGAILLPSLQAYGFRWPAPREPRWVVAAILGSFALSLGWLVYGKTSGNDFLEAGLLRSSGAWSLVLPGHAGWDSASRFSVGTLLPGLLASALILGLGCLAGRMGSKHG